MTGMETVEVDLDAVQNAEPNLMGTLHCQRSGKGELFSFKYAKDWLDRAEAFAFDPDLALDEGHPPFNPKSAKPRHPCNSGRRT